MHKSKIVNIDGANIGSGEPCYFIAEIAGNFSCEEEAVRIVDSAKRAGANAVKFQTFDPATVTTRSNRFDMGSVGNRFQYEVFVELQTPPELQLFIVDYCRSIGVAVFSAPSHMNDLELMAKFDMPVYKIGSDLATHLPLLMEVAKLKKPIILSTGMCTIGEIDTSVETIYSAGNDQLILLHCVSNYPGLVEEQNLKAILTMKNTFMCPTGFSDHTVGIDVSLAAIALGADIIERHYWCAGNIEGCDKNISSDEEEFGKLVAKSKYVAKALGDGVKRPSFNEIRNMKTNRVSIIVMKDIKAGTILEPDMLDIRRPGNGLAPKYWEKLVGKRVMVDLKKEEPLEHSHVEWTF